MVGSGQWRREGVISRRPTPSTVPWQASREVRPRGWPAHYRASIAAWLGHRDQAMELLSQSRAEGWGSFYHFHDNHRVLFEPLEGMDDYEDLLHPDG